MAENREHELTDRKKDRISETLPVIDAEDGLKRLMGNKKLYHRLLQKFVDEAKVEELILNIENNDLSGAALVAHALKGVAANLGLARMRELVTDMELKAKAGEDVAELVRSLREAAGATQKAIETMLEQGYGDD